MNHVHVYQQNKTLKEKQSTLDSVQQTHMMRLNSKLSVISYVLFTLLHSQMTISKSNSSLTQLRFNFGINKPQGNNNRPEG